MFKKFPMLSRLGIFLLLPLVVAVVALYQYVHSSLPGYSGQISLNGLKHPVDVNFDTYGTPTLSAKSDHDAYFAQGYLHASQRLWQMELQRKLVQGRSSELFGTDAVSTDIWMRTLGLHDAAQKAWHSLGKGAQQALEAYAAGVNAWHNSGAVLPVEYVLLDLQPEPWRPADSLAWQKILALDLGQNMYDEINRLSALALISPAQLRAFYPYDPDIKLTAMDLAVPKHNKALPLSDLGAQQGFKHWQQMKHHLATTWSLGEPFAGSNGWVVSGQHTQSGGPMLANDPHLAIEQNSLWYAMQMSGDKLDVSGMSIVGIPGIILGRNSNIAWGATALTGDQQDLFIVDVALHNNRVYETDKGSEAIETTEQRIDIRTPQPQLLNKKVKPVLVQIRKTGLGPIVSDAIQTPARTMALRWSALDDDDRSFESFYRLQYATNWGEFREAVQLLKAPGLHFLYADNQGNIGGQVAGHLPIRGAGVGVLPQQAFSSANRWQGYVPFEQLPSVYNPDSGVIVSANNQIDSATDIAISHEWAPKARHQRITELITRRIDDDKALTIDDMVEIQTDQVDLNARRLLPILRQHTLQTLIEQNAPHEIAAAANAAFAELAQWNGEFGRNSAAASIYHYWFTELKKAVFSAVFKSGFEAPGSLNVGDALVERVSEEQLLGVLTGDNTLWCSQLTGAALPCERELLASFYSAIRLLKKHSRSLQLQDWQWGQLHHVEFSHRLFGRIDLLEKLFSKKLAVGGSSNTVNVAHSVGHPSGGYQQTLGAAFRQIFDMGGDNRNAYIMPSGQSAHFLSDHYQDQLNNFIDGDIHYFAAKPDSATGPLNRLLQEKGHDKSATPAMTLIPGRL